MSVDLKNSPDAPGSSWLNALTQHLGLVVSGIVFGLISLRVLGVAKFDVVTALAIVQTGGAANVAIGSVVASVPTIATLILGAVGTSLAAQLAVRPKSISDAGIKATVYVFAALFVYWVFVAFATVMFALLILCVWWLKMRKRRRISALDESISKLVALDAEGDRIIAEHERARDQLLAIKGDLDRLEAQSDDQHSEAEFAQLQSRYDAHMREFAGLTERSEQHLANSAEVRWRAKVLSSRFASLKLAASLIKSKYVEFKANLAKMKSKVLGLSERRRSNADGPEPEKKDPRVDLREKNVDPEVEQIDAEVQGRGVEVHQDGIEGQLPDPEVEQIESEVQEREAEVQQVQQQQRDVQESRPDYWATATYWVVVIAPQVLLTATLSWLPTESITTKSGAPFPAFVLSESDKEVVLLRRDRGNIQRLPAEDLKERQICRSSSGVWTKSIIALTTSTPNYQDCPDGIDEW